MQCRADMQFHLWKALQWQLSMASALILAQICSGMVRLLVTQGALSAIEERQMRLCEK